MPMDRRLYPSNWEALALAIKTEANWRCEECDRPCRRPGESRIDFSFRMAHEGSWPGELFEDDESEGRWQRFTLTVAHLDHIPSNCDRSNLKALCAPCHCRYDLAAMPLKKRLKRERLGQLRLEGV